MLSCRSVHSRVFKIFLAKHLSADGGKDVERMKQELTQNIFRRKLPPSEVKKIKVVLDICTESSINLCINFEGITEVM